MCKNLPIFNLPNKRNDLILEIDAINEHWSTVLKKSKKEINSVNIRVEVLIKHHETIP